MSWKLNFASKAILPEGSAVDEQLLKLGIKPEDLDYVFLTHLDVDHVSGVKLVKDAKHICASEDELEAVEKGDIRYNPTLWEGINIEPVKMKTSNFGPFKKSYDLFGDESVLLVDVSGHSNGTMGVMIRNNGKFVIITSDSCYNHKSWQKLKLPGIVKDKERAMASLKWVHAMSKDKNCEEILATHDDEVEPHVITL